MPNDLPAGFVPDEQRGLPTGFVPDHPAVATRPTATISAGQPKALANDFEGTGKYLGNPLDRYMREAENMTVEGAKQHPIQNALGRTATRARDFGNILSTMGTLFMGPEGMTPAAGMHETPLPHPLTVKQLPAARSIQAPVSSLEPPLSMREQAGATLPTEAPTKVAPIPAQAMPARAPSLGASTLEPRPEVVTGPVKPPSTRSLINRLGDQIEDVSKHPAIEPTARLGSSAGLKMETDASGIKWAVDSKGVRVSIPKSIPVEQVENYAAGKIADQTRMQGNLRATVGAKAVAAEPNTELSGPAIKTPSRNLKLLENMKNRVPGSNPIEPRVTMGEQPPSELRTPAQVEEESLHTMERQQVHVNGARTAELTKGKPGLMNDMLNLEGEQIREVLRKSGEDMTNIQTVGRSGGKSGGFGGGKIVDPKNLSRGEALEMLYEKGYTPEQIVKEAPPRSKPAPLRKAFGPPLKNPLSGEGL